MGNDIKEENNTPRPQGAEGGNNNNNNRNGGRRARNRWNNVAAGGTPTQGNKFKTRTKTSLKFFFFQQHRT